MEYWCDCFGEAWGKLQWGVTPWVHWAVVHSTYFARRFGSLYIFRSIPTEYGNQPFKRHVKNSMRDWCLARPHITLPALRHVVHTDALNVGLHLQTPTRRLTSSKVGPLKMWCLCSKCLGDHKV